MGILFAGRTGKSSIGAWPFKTKRRQFPVSRQHNVLTRLGELALQSNNPDKILGEACRLVAEALSADFVTVFELQDEGETLKVRAGVGWSHGIVGVQTIAAAENTPEGATLKAGGPIVVADIGRETRCRYPSFVIDHGVRAVAEVVIGSDQKHRPFGVLAAANRVPREFTSHELAFFSCYGHFIATAMTRIQAFETLEAKKRALQEANARLQRESEERLRAEEALRQSQKMAAVGQVTGGLSHDFNNILATVSGNIELLGRRVAQGRVAELDHFIEASSTAVNRAVALTQRLLAFSRRQTLDPKVVNLNDVIRGMEDLIRSTVGPFIVIELKLASDLRPVRCDPNQVETALLNLAINARDAMPKGGQLTFESRNTALPAEYETATQLPRMNLPSRDYVGVSVTDTGQGMSQSVIESALDPFFTTKPIGQGTGLGLSMINSFVQQSGGMVQLRSQLGHGTTVMMYFPPSFETIPDQPETSSNDCVPPPG